MWGPWALKSKYVSKRVADFGSSLEPVMILAGLFYHPGMMMYKTKLSDFPCIEPITEGQERFISLAFQVANVLASEHFLLGRRIRRVLPLSSGPSVLPIVLWVGLEQFRTDAVVYVQKLDKFICQLGSKGLIAGFLARRRYYVGLRLRQVPGFILEVYFAMRLLALESLISKFWTTRIPEGLPVAGLKEQLLIAPDLVTCMPGYPTWLW